jgi:hypothetical protein
MRHVNYTEKNAYATKIGDNWIRRIMDHFFSLPWEGERLLRQSLRSSRVENESGCRSGVDLEKR